MVERGFVFVYVYIYRNDHIKPFSKRAYDVDLEAEVPLGEIMAAAPFVDLLHSDPGVLARALRGAVAVEVLHVDEIEVDRAVFLHADVHAVFPPEADRAVFPPEVGLVVAPVAGLVATPEAAPVAAPVATPVATPVAGLHGRSTTLANMTRYFMATRIDDVAHCNMILTG
jgi:hypothetical protein